MTTTFGRLEGGFRGRCLSISTHKPEDATPTLLSAPKNHTFCPAGSTQRKDNLNGLIIQQESSVFYLFILIKFDDRFIVLLPNLRPSNCLNGGFIYQP